MNNQPLPQNPNGLTLPYNATTMKIIDSDHDHILVKIDGIGTYVFGRDKFSMKDVINEPTE